MTECCGACGTQNDSMSNFCQECGTKIPDNHQLDYVSGVSLEKVISIYNGTLGKPATLRKPAKQVPLNEILDEETCRSPSLHGCGLPPEEPPKEDRWIDYVNSCKGNSSDCEDCYYCLGRKKAPRRKTKPIKRF